LEGGIRNRAAMYLAGCLPYLPAFVEPWARLTVRLRQALEAVGIATCGEVGTRLAERLALPTSPTTLLRRINA